MAGLLCIEATGVIRENKKNEGEKMKKLRLVAMMLAAVMMFNEAGFAYATSELNNVIEDAVVVEEAVSDNAAAVSNGDATVTISDNDVYEETVENNGETTEVSGEVSEEESVPDSNEEKIIREDTVSENDMQIEEGEITAADFPGMELSAEMIAQKAEVAAVVAELESAVPGEAYVNNLLIFTADTKEDAEKIAAAYNQENVLWQDGIAMMYVPYDTIDVLKLAADMNNNLPAVYPNLIYKAANVGTAVVEEDVTEKTDSSPEALAGGVSYASNADYAKQWHHSMAGITDAWDVNVTGDGVKVAVIDSGIDTDHPDLVDNIKGAYSTVYETNWLGYPVDENGNMIWYVEDLDKAAYLTPEDEYGHGTHVAGIIAAANNDIGGVGVAPEADIYSIRALDENGSGTSYMIWLAVKKARELKVDVINMSLGTLIYDYIEAPEIANAIKDGIVVVAAAGNEGGYYSEEQKNYPAGFPSVISVGAQEKDGDLAWFSTWGDWVTIAAPGGTLYGSMEEAYNNNLVYGSDDIYSTYLNGTYGFMAGTSQASPVVAGTVALILDARDNELAKVKGKSKVTKITNILLDSADGASYSADWGYVYSTLNASEAVLSANVGKPVLTPSTVIDATKASQPTIASGNSEYITVTADNEDAVILVTTNGKNPTWTTYEYYGYGEIQIPAAKTGNVTVKATVMFGDRKLTTTQKYKMVAKAESIYAKNGEAQNITIGKSVTMEVVFNPVYTTDKKMKWTSSDTVKFPVNAKSGAVKCTTKAQAGDTATITGILEADPTKTVTVTVTAVAKGVSTVTLANPKDVLQLATYESTKHSMKASYDLANDITANCAVSYTSSNKKVATVDEKTGLINAVGKGSCNITVKALDGSGKKVVKKVKVTALMADLNVGTAYGTWSYMNDYMDEAYAGQVAIAKGCSIKFNTYAYGYAYGAVSNKKINWTSTNPNVKVSGSKIVCNKNAATHEKATLIGEAADGSGLYVKFDVTVYDKPTKLAWKISGREKTSVNVTVKLGKFHEWVGSPYVFYPQNGDVYLMLSRTMSNTDVCYFDYDAEGNWGLVATKKGKCVITYKAQDGSNKTCKYTITVK